MKPKNQTKKWQREKEIRLRNWRYYSRLGLVQLAKEVLSYAECAEGLFPDEMRTLKFLEYLLIRRIRNLKGV